MQQPDSPADDDAILDVFMQGTTFFDMVLTGLPSQPVPGTEIHAEGMGSCPGGIANLAIAASRLGLRTGLASTFGDAVYGDFLWRTLQQEGVDLSRSQRVADWHSPVTISLAMQRDIVMRLNAEMVKIVQRRDFQELLSLQGVQAMTGSPDGFAQRIKSEMEKTARVVRESGMQLN